jgi:predicted phage terminase large subunit-like protein
MEVLNFAAIAEETERHVVDMPYGRREFVRQQVKEFESVFQSWDAANKSSELSDFSVCTTWGLTNKHLYLLEVLRRRPNYPDLRRTVKQQAENYRVKNILIEDKASGTQLIQDLIADGVHRVTRYEPKIEKVMRMHSVTSTIENGFVHIPEQDLGCQSTCTKWRYSLTVGSTIKRIQRPKLWTGLRSDHQLLLLGS